MTGSASNQLRSAYVAESTAGTTPSSPSFVTSDVPILINATPNIYESKTLAAGGARAGTGVSGLDVSGTMSGTFIYGNYDTWLETLFQGAFATNVLKDAKVVKTVTVENAIPAGVGGTNTMMRYRGVQATGGSLTLTSDADVQFSFDVQGIGSDIATTSAIGSSSYANPTNKIPLQSGVDVGTIVYDGYTLNCMESSTLTFTYENRERQTKLASNDLCGITRGALVPSITARIYVEANFLAIYNAARANHTSFAVTYPLGSVSGSKYTILFPRCNFTGADLDFSGADAMQDVTIMPQYDTSNACVVKITRAVS